MAWARSKLAWRCNIWTSVAVAAGLGVTAGCTTFRAGPPVAGPPAGDRTLEVIQAVGERLRAERGAFVVYPTFLDKSADPLHMDAATRATAVRLLEALRQGARTTYADTLAFGDANRRAMLPDSLRYFFTLTSVPVIQRDTAYVDVFGGVAMKTDRPIEQDVMRYWFVRAAGTWRFLRRQLLYAT